MTTHYDKLLITHQGALRHKYGTAGAAVVRDALDALIAADRARGLSTRVVSLDNSSTARTLGTPRVGSDPQDWAAVLRFVDRAAEKWQPAYLCLIGATDVVPQAQVTNPMLSPDDTDPFVPSDLPYACDVPTTWQGTSGTLLDAGSLLAVTRVVGRIPDEVGATDPALLLRLLDTAATWTKRSATDYQKMFALTAAAWRESTTLSTDLLPGPSPQVNLSPPGSTGWTKTQLAPLTHFVNCHGGDTTPDWFGQRTGAAVGPVALRPEDVDGRIKAGTVVAAECCYGALHAAPADLAGRLPMLWAYLRSGAYAAFGSSTIAYGPAIGNGQADLLCRFALESMMTGASSGRAVLEARQRYVREAAAMGPADLKTLAQFSLLGDPSITVVEVPGLPKLVVAKAAPGEQRQELVHRRLALRATGQALGASVPRAGRTRRPGEVDAAALARDAGLSAAVATGTVTTYGEQAGTPRAGYRFHVLPVNRGRQTGFVVAREAAGERQVTTIWRK